MDVSAGGALKAAFEAFRPRPKRLVLARASLIYTLAVLILFGGLLVLNPGPLGAFIGWYGQVMAVDGDLQALSHIPFPPVLFGLFAQCVLVLFCYFALSAAYEACCLRWLIQGRQEGLLGFDFGPDERRIYAGYWVWGLLYLTVWVAIGGVFGALAMGLVALGVDVDAVDQPASPLQVAARLAQLGVIAAIGIRFAPAAALSIARGRLSFASAWLETKPRFASLAMSYAALYALLAAALAATWALGALALFSGAFPTIAALGPGPDPQVVLGILGNALLEPRAGLIGFILLAVHLAIAPVFMVALFGVNARVALSARPS